MDPSIDISIVIINYNTFQLTCDCIRSILRYTRDVNFEIILVDNGSRETDPENFQKEFPSVNLVKSPANLGFAGGNNLGIKQAKGQYILLLNSDAAFVENTLQKTLNKVRELPLNIGFVGVKTNYPDGRFQQTAGKLPTIKNALVDLFGLHKLDSTNTQFEKPTRDFYTEFLYGSFLFFDRKLLKRFKENKLNDIFFMYHEDILWCWEARKAGFKNYYYNGTTIIHHSNGSQLGDKTRERMSLELISNRKKLVQMINGRIGTSIFYFLRRLLQWRVWIFNGIRRIFSGMAGHKIQPMY